MRFVFKRSLFQQFFTIMLSLLLVVCLVRVYEYFAVASKFFIEHAWRFEVAGLIYDVWLWSIYSFIAFIPFMLLHWLNKRLPVVVLHVLNVIVIVIYLALIITFSERNTPFDHEFFTRKFSESILTAKQMMTGSVKVFLPFVIYILLYFVFYYRFFKNRNLPQPAIVIFSLLAVVGVVFVQYAEPSQEWFSQTAGWYLVSNKLTYWVNDSYHYFATKDEKHILNNKQLESEIDFYQHNQPFQFTSKEYPLMHLNNGNDVLGSFFNLNDTPPNIVIVVFEGLSRDFSGANAYAGSFTPFLDSLSTKSLVWDNFLSTAPGTFAAQPAITASVPYGKRGFSIMNVMPDHLSLIKILKQNGYFTNFMIGFNPDFDNMGGYIRLQGTDLILNRYPSKYKQMGVGSEGWSMGYPDDDLYSRSFEVLDSINRKPYLSIYHTATSHMPYLFEQKPQYEKVFDEKIKHMNVSPNIRRTLKQTKEVLVTFMFADDCLKKFFADYSKRAEFNNTIFFITGDHHIGSFPSTGAIDDYHVPFIVYSPMLKKPQKFLSVSSHNNIAPTIVNLLTHNYRLAYVPKEVHWLCDVVDTCTCFRNIQRMPFMEWNREISDYIYKEYFISGNQLYKLTPSLLQEEYENDSIKKQVIKMRENFKIINSYVCDNNKIYPVHQSTLPGNKEFLLKVTDTLAKTIFSRSDDTTIVPDFKVPTGYKYLYVEVVAKVNLPSPYVDNHPVINMALIDTKNKGRSYLYETHRDIVTLSKQEFIPQHWNDITTNDLFTLDDYKRVKNLKFAVSVYTDSIPINLKMQKLEVRYYGVREK